MFWQSASGQVLIGIVSNLLFVLLLTAVGVIYVRAVLARRSRPLRRLLGVDGAAVPGAVRILVSSIYVVQGGTLGVRAQRTGFFGPVMNQSEYVAALRLAEAIQTKPAARLLRALLDQLGLLDDVHNPLDCSIVFSPQYVDSPDGGPVSHDQYTVPDISANGEIAERMLRALAIPGVHILIGGPVYNAAVHYALTHLHERTRFRFDVRADENSTMRGLSVLGYHQDGGERFFPQHAPNPQNPDRTPARDYFVLQKISRFGPAGATVFLCAGLSSIGTAMAAGLLATRWEQLEREFRGEDFALLYRFENGRDNPAPTVEDVDIALAAADRIWPRPH